MCSPFMVPLNSLRKLKICEIAIKTQFCLDFRMPLTIKQLQNNIWWQFKVKITQHVLLHLSQVTLKELGTERPLKGEPKCCSDSVF